MRIRLGLAAVIGILPGPSRAWAQDVCTASYERAQELRLDGDLVGARQQLQGCSQASCAVFMQQDCARWLSEVETALPTVVLTAKDDSGRHLTAVRVTMDGTILATRLDGRSLSVNPGSHKLSFETDGMPAVPVDLFVSEGQKNQLVEVTFHAPVRDSEPPQPQEKTSRVPAYVLGSLGLVGLAGFGIFALSGTNAEADLRDSACAQTKTCTDAQTDPVERKYLLADISLGIGLVSLGAATYWWLHANSSESKQASGKTQLTLQLGPASAYAGVSGSY